MLTQLQYIFSKQRKGELLTHWVPVNTPLVLSSSTLRPDLFVLLGLLNRIARISGTIKDIDIRNGAHIHTNIAGSRICVPETHKSLDE